MPDSAQPLGILVVDKPTDWTSHDVIAHLRRVTRMRRLGHAGTLDPLATGVLIVCVGLATRLSEYLMAGDKVYRAGLHLGIETNTYDAEGEVVARGDTSGITQAAAHEAALAFVGEIAQVPPAFSAIKRNGRPVYHLARRGEQVELEPRIVTIGAIETVDWSPPLWTVDVTCGKGTYIRSLAHDLGQALGCGAHLAALRRLRSGAYGVEMSVPLDALQADTWRDYLISPWDALADRPRVLISVEQCAELTLGRTISLDDEPSDEPTFAFDADRHLWAVLIRTDEPGRWRPTKVFAGE